MTIDSRDCPWSAIAHSLADYDRPGLAEALRVTLDSRLNASGRLGMGRQAAFSAVERDIARYTGVWSGAGPRVGHENLSGWCICHSFCRAPEGAQRAEILTLAVQEILAELDHIHGYLSALRDTFSAVGPLTPDPGEQLLQLRETYRRATELTVEWSGCHDAWYNTLDMALAWCAEALGVSGPKTADVIFQKISQSCTSWSEPAPQDIDWLVDELALATSDGPQDA